MRVDQLLAVLIPVFAALLGGVASYFASYAVEKRKWEADAAIHRRDSIYSPLFDELGAVQRARHSLRSWTWGLLRPRFQEWEKRKESAVGLAVPKSLARKLNSLVDPSKEYDEARTALFEALRGSFPGRHVDRNDYGVLLNLADFILLGFEATNCCTKRFESRVLHHPIPRHTGLRRNWIQLEELSCPCRSGML
jgi:hypothetical protein